MASEIFDVIVVGSGPGGGIATHALTRNGLRVALVEAGPRLRAGVDYNAHGSVHDNLDRRLRAGRSPLFRVTDFSERNHFTPVGDRPAHGFLKALGGRSLCWAGHSLRFGPLDYQRWPIRYEEVAPYYSKAEHLMCVYGFRDGLSNLPDGEFLSGVPLRCGEQMLRQGVERLRGKGRRMAFVAQRKAMATEPVPGRTQCHFCGHCMAGCEVDAKYTSANTPIPLAMKTGKLTLFTGATMTRILMKDARHVEGIEVTQQDGTVQTMRCRALVLACSAIETARHLLLNTSAAFPAGLANSSGQVGRNLTSHFGLTVTGVFPQLRGRDASNDDGTDYYHGLLTGMYWDVPNSKFEGTYQVQCGSGMHPLRLGLQNVTGIGVNLKRELRELNACHSNMNMQGSLLVSSKKFIDLDRERKDRLGLALPRVHLEYEASDIAMANDMIGTSEEIIRAAGGRVHSTPGTATSANLVIDSNHWVGTARMGKDPKKSVVNTDGQCHDVPNLFIGDASVFAAYPEKNPTLTNIALSWRMADALAAKARAGELS
jgi:choline dehydrogenase-like flavoprotein